MNLHIPNLRSAFLALAGALASLGVAVQCASTDGEAGGAVHASVSEADGVRAFSVVYDVLQHPRCMNCHPMGDVPLQGDDSRPHAQNVQSGPDGKGLYAMECSACHGVANLSGAHLPPGAPNWHLPSRAMPLVFEGQSEAELCRQLKDRATNGGKTPEQLFEHMAHDPLVLWGWAPGDGRTPVPIPHAELVAAVRTWVDSGCACPE
jgi:hypothetical protein